MSRVVFRQLFAFLLLAFCFITEANAQTYFCTTDSDIDGIPVYLGAHPSTSQCGIFGFGSNCCPIGQKATTSVAYWPGDNCAAVSNSNQLDTDGDGVGDVCDSDAYDNDYDGVGNATDNCPVKSNTNQLNTDGDTKGDICDTDDDNDGVLDTSDRFPLNAAASSDSDYDGFPGVWNASCNALCQSNSGLILDNCPSVSNANQLDADHDGIGDACDPDDNDKDGISDADETTLGNNPLNNFDPPAVAISSRYIFGVDNHTPGSSFTRLWNSIDGSAAGTDACDTCIVPGVVDGTTSASGDVCGVFVNGIKCLWWVMDTGDVNNEELLPVQIAGETVTPLHDWDGYLKYVDASSVLHNVATDAFKISSDHFSHACIVSKTLGVYCWASHSGTDIISGNVPAALQNVSTVKDIAVGANHACAINGSAVQCWGDTASGKTTVPVIVNVPKQIVAGANHTCAINANSSVSCWGDNNTNQLGDSNADGVVDGVSNALRISAGKNHTCAVTGSYSTPSGLRVMCWGDNSVGQTTVPVALTNGVEKPVTITAAENQTCAIRAGQNIAANAMICWPVTISP